MYICIILNLRILKLFKPFYKLILLLFLVLLVPFHFCKKNSSNSDVEVNYPYQNPSLSPEERASDLLSRLTLDEKVGQMTQIERSHLLDINIIKDYYLGSILSGGGSSPSPNVPFSWADMYDSFQSVALETRMQIPIIYGIDAVHGHNNVYTAVIFPHNIGMGCTRNPALIEQANRAIAEEVVGTGIDWTFAPCIAVPRNERWGRTYEGFAETPELTRDMSEAAVRGFQGNNLADPATILACAKHFVGDGGTSGGVDQGNTVLDEATLREIHMAGYVSAIEAGVGSIMVSYNSWNGQKLHGHQYLLTTVLKGELGFDGFLISDWAAIDQLPGDYASDIETSINAGLDMIMVPDRYQEFINTTKTLVQENRISMERIDDAVKRILKIKFRLGLFENPLTDRAYTATIGSNAHRQIARECVRQSLVLLKNENSILPLRKDSLTIHVAGKNADDLGNQCGGWTITWQGSSGDITWGTNILQAIRTTVHSSTEVNYSYDGSNAAGSDVGIAVIGERPYAEGAGDRSNLNLDSDDLNTIQNFKNSGIPFIVILVSGRPMIIDQVIEDCDAFIAAWLPGTEGLGVSDVLFGDYHPTGKLSHSWPRTMGQIPISYGDPNYDPLFPYGFGLTY
jgi:beta-glucosidase